MNEHIARPRYSSGMIALHWLMLVLIVALYAAIELRVLYPRGSAIREGLKTLHFTLGLAVFLLVWLRLMLRFTSQVPPIAPQPPRWQLRIAHLGESAIYVFMIAMPLLGWLTLSAEGKPISLFGLLLPSLTGANEALAGQTKEIHEITGKAGYALIGLHALAALVHHYLQRDNTLRRMLPGLSNPPASGANARSAFPPGHAPASRRPRTPARHPLARPGRFV
jgi:superoxide oxidase